MQVARLHVHVEGFRGLASRVQVVGSRELVLTMQGSGQIGVEGFGFRVQGLGFRVSGLEFRVWDSGFRVEGFVFWVEGLGFEVWGLGFRVEG